MFAKAVCVSILANSLIIGRIAVSVMEICKQQNRYYKLGIIIF